MSEEKWKALAGGLTDKVVGQWQKFVGEDAWNLISDTGKQDLVECAALLVECQLLSASGQDTSIAQAALKAAIGNWELSGRIRAADDFLDTLKEGLIEAGQIALGMLGAGLRGLVAG